jgi:Spy/CpxP family protein refolding chaperone
MSQKIILRTFVVLAVLAVSSLALAQGPHPMMKMQCEGGSCLPNLTEEQQTQIEKSKLNLDKELLPLEADVDVKRAELDKLFLVEKPDKKAVYKKVDEIGVLQVQIEKIKVDHKLEVRALLTPDQRVAFDKQHSKCGMRCHGMGGSCMGGDMKKMMKIKKMCCPMESQEELEIEKEVEIKE